MKAQSAKLKVPKKLQEPGFNLKGGRGFTAWAGGSRLELEAWNLFGTLSFELETARRPLRRAAVPIRAQRAAP